MYSFYLSGSGNGNHGAASKNRIIICNSTHAVAVDRMVINISISSLSWIFKQHYRDSSWLKIARQYCIWALVLRNTLSHAHTERISICFFFPARSWKWTSVAHKRQTAWHFVTSPLPAPLQIKAARRNLEKAAPKHEVMPGIQSTQKQRQNRKTFYKEKHKRGNQLQTNHVSELLELGSVLVHFQITATRKWCLRSGC